VEGRTASLPEWPIAAVQESDVDLVLLFEIRANPGFRSRLLNYAYHQDFTGHTLVGAWRNTFDSMSGETDVLLVADQPDGTRVALMIEDKIAARLQPRQAERYSERGETGRLNGWWVEFRTLLVAPASYLTFITKLGWTASLPLEEVAAWLEEQKTLHAATGAEILRHAASPRNREMIVNEAATNFWNDYLRYSGEKWPQLEVALPSAGPKGLGSIWPIFGAKTLAQDRRIEIRHKDQSKRVDLVVDFCSEIALKQAVSHLLEDGMSVNRAGKTAVVRIEVPAVHLTEPFQDQIEAIESVFAAGERLLAFCRMHRALLHALPRSDRS